MRLIYNMVTIPLNEEKWLVVNTLNGLMDAIDKDTFDTLDIWSKQNAINPSGDREIKLFNDLKRRGYLVQDESEENRIKEAVLAKLRDKHQQLKNNIQTITFILTYDCNFRCGYCFEADNPKSHKVLTKEMVDAAFSLTNESLNKVYLFGGEPLLPKNNDVIKYIIQKGKGKKFHITTNGYYLYEYFDLLKDIDIETIIVTLDGTKENHDLRRFLSDGGPTFEKIMKGVRICLENKINIKIRMNVDQNNFDDCKSLRSMLVDMFSNSVEYLKTEFYPIMQLTPDKRHDIYEKIYSVDIGKSKEEIELLNASLNTFKPIINYFVDKTPVTPLYNFCNAHNNPLIVDPEGDIYACAVSVGKKDYAVGTYYPKVKYKENTILSRNIESIKECSQCKYAFLCGGGCPMALSDCTDMLKPNCRNTIYDIYTMIPFLYKQNFIGGK